ncbi:uncharacterized protein LOC131619876 [Vicia villosa]|uniref:uncharacterized protein LOC131619876 n=1 Tax=Vicia villosa TaxID=3911 RepID=UPI00273BCFDC|nr:uncharacterized protein LOC131619876 [Vicia villosa]
MEAFPELFCMAQDHLATVNNAGFFEGGNWNWETDLLFDNNSRPEEGQQLAQLRQELAAAPLLHSLQKNFEDNFFWSVSTDSIFSVKSCYYPFKDKLSGPPLDSNVLMAIKHLWMIKAPSNILFFGWRFILNRIATKYQLVRRRIMMEGNDSLCVLCQKEEESLLHLFSSCEVTVSIWNRVWVWVGLSKELKIDEFVDYFHNCAKIKSLNKRHVRAVIWLATVWSLWIKRNGIIFKDESFSFTECMKEIISNSWRWMGAFYKRVTPCNFHFWNTLPLSCFEL